MINFIALLFGGMLSLLGMVLLALGQERHWCTVASIQSSKRISDRLLLITGLVLNLFALPCFVSVQGAGFGSLIWGITLSLTATVVTFTLAWQPRFFLPLAVLLRSS